MAEELVVIGGGIVGAATAFYASRAGLACTLLESRPGLAQHTTARAAGGYRLQLEHEDELPLVRDSIDLFRNFTQVTGQRADCGYRPRGYLWLTTDPDRAVAQRELVERQRSWGVDGVEVLEPADLRRRFPWVSGDVIQARFRGGDGLIDPVAVTHGLATASGARVVTGCRVEGFGVNGGRLTAIRTTAGRFGADRAVICAGPLSGTVARLAGVELPVVTIRRQRGTVTGVPELPAQAPMVIDEDTGSHWRPTATGAYVLRPEPGEPPAPPTEQVPVDPGFANELLDPASPVALARMVPVWAEIHSRGVYQVQVGAGQYTMTPDQRPLIGPTAVDGLWVNTGYSGHGVMAGPGGAQHLAALLTGSVAALNAFALDRTFGQTTQSW